MKTVFTMLLLLTFALPPALAKDHFDHIGSMVFHAEKIKSGIEGRTDLYYSDDYVCLPGTDNEAPMCRKADDWYFTQQAEYAEMTLDDGQQFILTRSLCAFPAGIVCEQEKWDHSIQTVRVPHAMIQAPHTQDDLFSILYLDWIHAKQNPPKDGERIDFHYRVARIRNGSSVIQPKLSSASHP